MLVLWWGIQPTLTLLYLQLSFFNGWEWKYIFNVCRGSRAVFSPKCKITLVKCSVLLQSPAFKLSLISVVSVFRPWLSSGGRSVSVSSSGCQRFTVRCWIKLCFSRRLSQALGAFCTYFVQEKIFYIHNKEFIPGLFLFCMQYFSYGSTHANTMGCYFVVPVNEVNSSVFQLMIITQLYS